MIFAWLKRFSPRGLYGRAALILVAPMVILLAIMSIIFIQRHYEDVTRQMVHSLSYDLNLIVDRVNASSDQTVARATAFALADELEIVATFSSEEGVGEFTRAWYDFSAEEVFREMNRRVAGVVGVRLSRDLRRATFLVETNHGLVSMRVLRGRISASNPHQFLVLLLIVTIIMVVITMVFFRNQLRPIRRLARASDAFGRGQNIDYRPSGATEVRLAGSAFLDMRSRIERQMEQRTLMLSGVSHDLRTPLTRMRLALEMLDDQEAAADVVRDITDMERLLDEFLAFAQGDSFDDPVLMSPEPLVRDLVARFPESEDRISVSEPLVGKDILLRPMAIERALTNLIGNALRYGKNVLVSIKDMEKSLVFVVEDDGPGIAPDHRDDVIRPFVRLDEARNQDHGGGVGLGLAITRDIARRHGGALRLGESQSLGGLMVEIIIPR